MVVLRLRIIFVKHSLRSLDLRILTKSRLKYHTATTHVFFNTPLYQIFIWLSSERANCMFTPAFCFAVSLHRLYADCCVILSNTVYPKKYAHGFCFAVLCCGYTLTDFPISIRLTSLALWQSNDCPSASKATLMNMDKYFMWIHYERLHNHNKAKHNKTVCIFLGIYCSFWKKLNSFLSSSVLGTKRCCVEWNLIDWWRF